MSATKDKTTELAESLEEAPASETSSDAADAVDAAEAAVESAGGGSAGTVGVAAGSAALKVAGIAIFATASLTAAVFLGEDITLTSSPESRDEEMRREADRLSNQEERIDQGLTGQELVRLGEAALNEGRIDTARRLLDEARTRVPQDQVNLRIDLYSALARAEELADRDGVAALHRRYLDRLRESMGGSVTLLNEAEKLFREGKFLEARARYSQFLLRPGDLKEGSEKYLVQARDRLAEIMEREFAAASKNPVKLSLEPESYFRD